MTLPKIDSDKEDKRMATMTAMWIAENDANRQYDNQMQELYDSRHESNAISQGRLWFNEWKHVW